MDDTTKKVINYILYTLEHHPTPEDLEWSTEQVQSLLSKIKELQGHADKLGEIITGQTEKRLELENRVKGLEQDLNREITHKDALEKAEAIIKELKAHTIDFGKKLFDIINEKLKLEKGIENHKITTEKMMYYDRWDGKRVVKIADEELYKLLEKKRD